MFHLFLRLRPLIGCLSLGVVIMASACAPVHRQSLDEATLFIPPLPNGSAPAGVPIFLADNGKKPYNRIGTPRAVDDNVDGEPEIIVDPAIATTYYQRTSFSTARGSYTNEVYRIHFREVPLGWDTINLTGGNNPGLLVIYTLNQEAEPVLVTTVHTCGCYLAFLPTAALPDEAYPADWPEQSQWIYGYTLPSRLPELGEDERYLFTLADQTHRVSGVEPHQLDGSLPVAERIATALAPLNSLYRLPYHSQTVSFFETDGPRAGYVKNNCKPLERILLGWLALDFRVGEDKAYLGGDTSTVPLYTSLKFWARQESDLKDFPRFLAYWGWKL